MCASCFQPIVYRVNATSELTLAIPFFILGGFVLYAILISSAFKGIHGFVKRTDEAFLHLNQNWTHLRWNMDMTGAWFELPCMKE